MSSARLETLEWEMEMLRAALYREIEGERERLSHTSVLPISRELDDILNQYYAEKNRQPS
ncbi:aspartyl-phosphate phosphatase Spo0E family protein [Marininema halotolerans]|uniref:Spo0E like sporulation regulatory protein n=1 Tax=Marininema halotolerans TaxID=1155944 RepID=A0A1I6R521_9BACL|nr:aspartyl-phosphate phosphatase Spo0E family protein [Marininema halotolerans]SFS59861.1 Spo0E like sporulation regulatory protein [Marininema halotolerans]